MSKTYCNKGELHAHVTAQCGLTVYHQCSRLSKQHLWEEGRVVVEGLYGPSLEGTHIPSTYIFKQNSVTQPHLIAMESGLTICPDRRKKLGY